VVEYAGARWRVQRALCVEAILLRSEAGEEVSADPLKMRLTRSHGTDRGIAAPDR
jgi:hypothetical protein